MKRLEGFGHIDLKVPNLNMTNVTGYLVFVYASETYQLSVFYPSKQTSDAWQGQWAGVKLDGKDASLAEISAADSEFGSQLISEILRGIINVYIPVSS